MAKTYKRHSVTFSVEMDEKELNEFLSSHGITETEGSSYAVTENIVRYNGDDDFSCLVNTRSDTCLEILNFNL